jgi:hypothetical protein
VDTDEEGRTKKNVSLLRTQYDGFH